MVHRLMILLIAAAGGAPADDAPPRGRDLGIPFEGTPGPHNAITDVRPVRVGHSTVVHGDGAAAARTGVTAIMPHPTLDRCFAGVFTLNGNGEMTGTAFIREWGVLTSPVLLTNTVSVGTVRDGVIKWARRRPDIERDVLLPVVGETYDGFLNDIHGFHVQEQHVFDALDQVADGTVAEGNVGGGTGMMCHWFKGGIGTASRVLPARAGGHTIGVLVQANYGTRNELTIAGHRMGPELQDTWPKRGKPPEDRAQPQDGSILIVVATDAPLLPHQLERVARRASLGLARVGSVASTESGDLFLAFSTAPIGPRDDDGMRTVRFLDERRIDAVFTATVQATEEAIVNAMVAARPMTGFNGNHVPALPHDRVRALLADWPPAPKGDAP